jgi:hypothetical protein
MVFRTPEKCISDSRFKMGYRSVKVTGKGQRHVQPEADSNWKIHIQRGFEETADRNGQSRAGRKDGERSQSRDDRKGGR